MVQEGSAAEDAGIRAGDLITSINGHEFSSWDVGQIYLYYKDSDGIYDFGVTHNDGTSETISVKPNVVTDEEGNETRVFGIQIDNSREKMFGKASNLLFKNLSISSIRW